MPGGAGRGVGYLDVEAVQFGPDLVGAGPVLLLAGLGPLGDQALDRLDLGRVQVGGGAAALQGGRVQVVQVQAEQGVGRGDDDARPAG